MARISLAVLKQAPTPQPHPEERTTCASRGWQQAGLVATFETHRFPMLLRMRAERGCLQLRHHRSRLDLKPRLGLEQAADLNERHRRKMIAQHLAIGRAELAAAGQIFV